MIVILIAEFFQRFKINFFIKEIFILKEKKIKSNKKKCQIKEK